MKDVQTQLVRDVVLGVWFVAIGLAFWAPYAGLPRLDPTPLYGLCLTASLVAVELRLTRPPAVPGSGDAEEAQHG